MALALLEFWEPATTESGGDAGAYSSSGTAPNATSSLRSVQAHFAGDDLYEASDSVIRSYDVVSASAVKFNVTAADPLTDLTGFFTFNASIEFEELLSDGVVYVSECESPASDRYTSIDLCLSVSSAIEMAEGTSARVTISFDGKVPEGSDPDQVDIFHEELASDGIAIIDITESRDLDAETVTGRTTTFSALHCRTSTSRYRVGRCSQNAGFCGRRQHCKLQRYRQSPKFVCHRDCIF